MMSRPRASTPLPHSHPVGLLPAVLCIGLALGLLLWSAPEASPDEAGGADTAMSWIAERA